MSKKNQKQISEEIYKKMVQQELQHSLELRRKIVNKQLDKIQSMPFSELLQRQRRPKPTAPQDHTKFYMENQINNAIDEKFQSSVENPGQKHAQLFKQTQQSIRQYRRELKKSPIMAQVKRGKLGLDAIFIVFGLAGFVLLPLFFGKRIMKNKQKIMASRGVDPKVIQNLDEESPISLDSVSQQSIHYLNSDRQQEIKQKLKLHNKISQLKKQLDM